MSHYAVIFPEFWTGTTGRAIRSVGRRDAQLLALYLMTGPGATMIGLYSLRLEDIRHDTGLPVRAITRAFDALTAPTVQFADYDQLTAHVWVREMAKFKLGLNRIEGGVLDPKDKRAVGARRLYEALQPNPFLAPFFDRYHKAFHLKARRRYMPPSLNDCGPAFTDHKMSGLQGASKGLLRDFEGARKPEISTSGISTEQGSEIRDQDQNKAPRRGATSPQ